MAKTRTYKEVERDYRAIRRYVDTHESVSSFKEIAEALGLTLSQVNTSLKRHERTYKAIVDLMAKNTESSKEKSRVEKLENIEKGQNSNKVDSSSQEFHRYVIDASISGAEGLYDFMNEIGRNNGKIILTSVTINELEKMQRFYDTDGIGARRILALAAEHVALFECVLIDEKVGVPDDCIIKYCENNKDTVVLLTSDKTMCLKARAYGVETMFFKKSRNSKLPTASNEISATKKFTLFEAKKRGNNLVVDEFRRQDKKIRIISQGVEFNDGTKHLKVGDDVFVANKRVDYISFVHFKVTSLESEKNCVKVNGKRIYNLEQINNLSKYEYKAFLRDFVRENGF